MGRVTIFALTECPHCKRTKGALTERKIPYTEISLTTHPQKRTDMLSLADRLTVPQVFFNDKHIGGADDTLALLHKWDKESGGAYEKYKKEVEGVDGPTDKRLEVPTTPPVVEKPPPPRTEMNKFIELPHKKGKMVSALEITSDLVQALPRADLKYGVKVYKDSFKGSDGVAAIRKHYGLSSRDEAIKFGRELQRKQVLHHVTGQHTFGDNSYFFRLHPFQQPNVLNTYIVWTERVDPDAMALLGRLKKALGKVESAVTDSEGLVDYLGATQHPSYLVLEDAVCELQGVDMASMDNDTKLAFGINLYNLMIKHAFMKVGIAQTSLSRMAFFNNVAYNIGGDILTFTELENGILRGNSVPPYHLHKPFSSSDPKARLALPKADCRIHFALNCGAKSCPPVKKFSAGAIDEELRIVAQAFCEQAGNVDVNPAKNELALSMILNWYQSDFASSASKLPAKVVTFLRGEKRAQLERMISSGKPISVKFNEYDWSTNAKFSKTFQGSSKIKANESQMSAFFSGLTVF